MRYLARRFFHGVLLLLAVSLLSFVLIEMAPGNFFEEMRLNPQISSETVAALRARYGLDRPVLERYVLWAESALRGEFGFSFAYNRSVGSLLWARARNTLLLTATATLLAWLLAVPLGVWAASAREGWADRLFGGASSALIAIPDLLLALVFLWFAVRTGYFPTGGMVSPNYAGMDVWQKIKDVALHLFLPASALMLGTLPLLARHVRAAMVEVLASPFIQAARAQGISRTRLLFRHALPVAANPLFSLLGFSIASLFSASLLVEVIMSWPGLGPLLLEAILARDLFVVVGAVLLSTTLLVAGNFLADALLYLNDPRIRVGSL